MRLDVGGAVPISLVAVKQERGTASRPGYSNPKHSVRPSRRQAAPKFDLPARIGPRRVRSRHPDRIWQSFEAVANAELGTADTGRQRRYIIRRPHRPTRPFANATAPARVGGRRADGRAAIRHTGEASLHRSQIRFPEHRRGGVGGRGRVGSKEEPAVSCSSQVEAHRPMGASSRRNRRRPGRRKRAPLAGICCVRRRRRRSGEWQNQNPVLEVDIHEGSGAVVVRDLRTCFDDTGAIGLSDAESVGLDIDRDTPRSGDCLPPHRAGVRGREARNRLPSAGPIGVSTVRRRRTQKRWEGGRRLRTALMAASHQPKNHDRDRDRLGCTVHAGFPRIGVRDLKRDRELGLKRPKAADQYYRC